MEGEYAVECNWVAINKLAEQQDFYRKIQDFKYINNILCLNYNLFS